MSKRKIDGKESPSKKTGVVGGGGGGGGSPDGEWNVKMSVTARRTHNPIRAVVDTIVRPKEHKKSQLTLALGDPTIFGNLKAPDALTDAMVEGAKSFKYNGYTHSCGLPEAREAVAKAFSKPEAPLTADDVVFGSGASGALDIVISSMVGEGDNIVMPKPGFPLYGVIAQARGAEVREYNLQPEKGWEVDLEHLDSMIDGNTRLIVVNNPSNPCGSVYSKEHLLAILEVALRRKVPIVADEIYGNLIFKGEEFHSMASLTKDVPVISVSGLAKEYLVPGWRVGWALIHDRHDILKDVRAGIIRTSQLILGPSTLVQSGVKAVLDPPTEEMRAATEANRKKVMDEVEENAKAVCKRLAAAGLRVIEPRGSLYVMVGIDPKNFKDIADDREFAQKLLTEENVFLLPGQCFSMPNFLRVVFSSPMDKLVEACDRIIEFCKRHST